MFKLLLLNKPLKKLHQLMVPPLKLLIPQLNNSSLLNNWLKYKQKPRHKLMLNKQLPKQQPNSKLKQKKRNVSKKKRIKLNEKSSKHQEMLLHQLNRNSWINKKKKRKKRQSKLKLRLRSKLLLLLTMKQVSQ